MHFTIGLFTILASLKWANWKDWQQYYPTMLFMIVSNLLYKFFALSKFHLWKFSSQDFFFNNHSGIFLWHIFIINPLCIFIFLSNFPVDGFGKKILYIVKWVFIFILIEILMLSFDHIHYFNGWNLAWTVFFDFTMFFIIRIHYKRPLWALPVSVGCTLFYLFQFNYF